jgi:hypothetical protein
MRFFAAKAKNRWPETNQTNDNYNMIKLWLQWKNCRFLRRNSPFCSQIARTQVITAGRPFFGASRDRAGNPVDGQWSVCGRCLGLRGCGGTVSCVCVTFISIHPSGRIAQEFFYFFLRFFCGFSKIRLCITHRFLWCAKKREGKFPFSPFEILSSLRHRLTHFPTENATPPSRGRSVTRN